ncbi:Hypothetical protein, putative [Bodo saltans]|uniref:Uncharacterized protein n=1 Tax=Bodo saltans TaxID=75058 RepID=A0A0S4JPP0_BODSA|nr:Hypothetical protein, putative [Bodo saltans]|eukprot:CUG92477.1 Hypothetical protein, putative [Bodo saltans]
MQKIDNSSEVKRISSEMNSTSSQNKPSSQHSDASAAERQNIQGKKILALEDDLKDSRTLFKNQHSDKAELRRQLSPYASAEENQPIALRLRHELDTAKRRCAAVEKNLEEALTTIEKWRVSETQLLARHKRSSAELASTSAILRSERAAAEELSNKADMLQRDLRTATDRLNAVIQSKGKDVTTNLHGTSRCDKAQMDALKKKDANINPRHCPRAVPARNTDTSERKSITGRARIAGQHLQVGVDLAANDACTAMHAAARGAHTPPNTLSSDTTAIHTNICSTEMLDSAAVSEQRANNIKILLLEHKEVVNTVLGGHYQMVCHCASDEERLTVPIHLFLDILRSRVEASSGAVDVLPESVAAFPLPGSIECIHPTLLLDKSSKYFALSQLQIDLGVIPQNLNRTEMIITVCVLFLVFS